tara:strand:+ start:778 stop:879 length:102 start_codon:yes stop_codon:yes gene_type:complete
MSFFIVGLISLSKSGVAAADAVATIAIAAVVLT